MNGPFLRENQDLEVTTVDTVACPSCGQESEVQWRTTMDSTSGPVEHVKIRCLTGHAFFLPTSCLSDG